MIPSVQATARTSMQATVDDLERIATNITPIDTGQLRRSATKKVSGKTIIVGEVGFSAVNNSKGYGPFNYAIWTHEASYTPSHTGGTDGYAIGNKYLSRPLYGEAEKYLRWWAEGIKKGLEGR
ncbi:hypothetical protein [Melghirimyces algeriensis]|nr:hypothetical protein [Melghirimyces algeriensis]